MWRTASNFMMVATASGLLGGCGLTQTVADSTTSTASAIFYKQVKDLHLDFSGRAALNTDRGETKGLSVPTLVRVYQLRSNKAVEKATYESLLGESDSVLGADLLTERALVVSPGEGAQLSLPMAPDAEFVTVVALFRTPDTQLNTWRLTLRRNDLDPDQPRVIELGDNRLTLRPLVKE